MSERYYVGIGASAGGLEALGEFFKNSPNNTGLTFIVIQHLSPDFKSLMDELLARHTKMDVIVAKDGIEAKPNKVYLIPPRKNLSIFHGKLYLEDQKARNFLNLPIDVFLKSLALDQGKNSIGIILSGTGSDGTLGIRAIKEAGGLTMVQNEESAKFDGMPRSSIATGLIDYVLPPNKMVNEILNYINHPKAKDNLEEDDYKNNLDDLTKITMMLRGRTGIDFSNYKENTIVRRINRRIKVNRLNDIKEYLNFLSDSDKEKDILKKELLIGVTGFFRDKEAFASIKENVLPNIDFTRDTVRVWSVGCSSGEEAYSIAILLKEYANDIGSNTDVKIFATDVDGQAIDKAARGIYPASIVSDVDPELVAKYFKKQEGGFKVTDSIRKMVVFAKHNILKDPPFSKLDLLVCRNLFIYFKSEVQQKILASFYYSLAPNGFMFLGSSESIGSLSDGFETLDSKWKIFKYKEGYKPPINSPIVYPTNTDYTKSYKEVSFKQSKIEKVLMEAFSLVAPPSIIIDDNDNIIHIINNMSKFMTLQPGRFSNKISTNVSRELALYINNLVRRLKSTEKNLEISNVIKFGSNKGRIKLKGNKLEIDNNNFYLISFYEDKDNKEEFNLKEVEMSTEIKDRVQQLENELQIAQEGLQATIEELETSNEELQSSNEELIASNEELQSTNEELQSVNEELFTVNNEHQQKIEQLIKLNNDLNNLIRNTNVGALYLDKKLAIRKITPLVSKVTNIMESDIGRPIFHISIFEKYPSFSKDINDVLESLVGKEKELWKNDKCYLIRIKPYRTEYNSVEGIIVTFIDVTRLKTEQRRLHDEKQKLEMVLDMAKVSMFEYNDRTKKIKFSENISKTLGFGDNDLEIEMNNFCSFIVDEDCDHFIKSIHRFIHDENKSFDVKFSIKSKDKNLIRFHSKAIVKEKNKRGDVVKITGVVFQIND